MSGRWRMLRRRAILTVAAAAVLALIVGAAFSWWPREQTRSLASMLLTKGELPISLAEYAKDVLSASEGIDDTQVADVGKLEFRPDVCKLRRLDWMKYSASRSIFGDHFTGLLYPEVNVTVTVLDGVGDESNALLEDAVSGVCGKVVYVNREAGRPEYQTVSATVLDSPGWSYRYPSRIFFETVESDWNPVLRDVDSPGRESLYARVTVSSIAVHLFAVRDDRSRSTKGFPDVTVRQLLALLEAQAAKVEKNSS